MSLASDFLASLKNKNVDTLEALASKFKDAGDERLSVEMTNGGSKDNLTEGLLALALNLHLNGDDALWNELGLKELIKESIEAKKAK